LPHAVRANPIPTGLRALDQELGTGGWPAGRIVELFGDAIEAKRLLLHLALASAQRMGGGAALLCPEGQTGSDTALRASVDLQRLVILHPHDEAEALAAACDLTQTGTMAAVAVCGFWFASELEGDAFVKLSASARRTGTLVLFCSPPWGPSAQAGHTTGTVLRRFADVRVCILPPHESPGRPYSVTLDIATNRVGGRRGRLTTTLPHGP